MEPSNPRMQGRWKVHGLVLLPVVLGVGCSESVVEADRKIRLVYGIELDRDPNTDLATSREIASVLQARLEHMGFERYGVSLEGEDRVVVDLPGDTEGVSTIAEQLEFPGNVRFHLVARDSPSAARVAKLRAAEERFLEREAAWAQAMRAWNVERGHLEQSTADANGSRASARKPERPSPPTQIVREVEETGRLVIVRRDEFSTVDGEHLVDEAAFTRDWDGDPAVAIEFDDEGAREMRILTQEHIQERLAIMVDDKVVSAPLIQSRISRHAIISGKFSKEDIFNLAMAIEAGALPTRIKLIEKVTIGKNSPPDNDS